MTTAQKRKNAAEVLNGPNFIQNGITHTYSGLVKTLLECKQHPSIELPKDAKFSAVDCVPETCSNHEVGVHVFADSEPYDKGTHETNAAVIRSEIKKHHNVIVPEVIFLDGYVLESFSCNNCSEVHKFKLRDSYLTNQLCMNIHYISKSEQGPDTDESRTDLNDMDSSKYCKVCFCSVEKELSRPLDWRNFSVLNEWYLEVPLELQIILTNLFINKSSLRHSDDVKTFVSNKLFRLFSILENGLSVYNKNFYGVIQQLNTEELIVNYHTVSTVFNITGQSCITRGLTFANEWLQRRADEDLVYFETVLKKFYLNYKSSDGQETTKLVSMRDCLAILFLDNLVRLRRHGDADRSSTKTSQLCTLPLTVKGLPRDSFLISSWHLQDCTRVGSQCSCLEVCKHSKADLNLLTDSTEAEAASKMKFETQVLFGIGFFVTELRSLVAEYLTVQNNEIIDTGIEIEELNQSLMSISINETLPLTTEDLERIAEIEREQLSDIDSEIGHSEDDNHSLLSEVGELSQSFISISMNDEIPVTFEDEEQKADTEKQQVSDVEFETSSDMIEQQTKQKEVEELNKSFIARLMNDEPPRMFKGVENTKLNENVHSILADDVAETDFIHGIGVLDMSIPESEDQEIEPFVRIPPSLIDIELSETATTHTSQQSDVRIHKDFLLAKFKVPPTLCRHPMPAKGRDDDINVLRDILLGFLTKLGRYPGVVNKERILFAPDHKISKNLIQLMKIDTKFQQFLPEFPVLHLKKSKINNMFSAYSNAGIIELLRYMKDSEQEDDWMDLITLRNIETAARNIKRLALGLHLAFLVRFICTLSDEDLEAIIEAIDIGDLAIMNQHWMQRFHEFLNTGIRANATFALHYDIMVHCDEIMGISVAERIGGEEGYSLLLACVKSSLPFSFLNGATSYASFCVELLHVHYSAGPFHQRMKQCLFSTPHKDSEVNFALDTQREMDHQEALKGFRPRATLETVIPRMAVVDHFTQVQKTRRSLNQTDASATNSSVIDGAPDQSSTTNQDDTSSTKQLNFDITQKDLTFILPLARLVLRSGGLAVNEDDTPRNIYNTTKPALSKSLLDRETYSAGQFLVKKYACTQGLFQLTTEDIPNVTSVQGSKDILKKIKKSKGVTLRRSTIKSKNTTEAEIKESKRKALVKKQTKVIDCHSSDMNACQALVNPDCSKPSVQKSQGIKKALYKLLSLCLTISDSVEDKLSKENLIMSGILSFPFELRTNVAYATLEFAGVKFQTKATSGVQYLQGVEKGTICRLLKEFPRLKRIVVCEEKYSYTPDDFKSATRAQRQKSSGTSISHLKIATEILSDDKMTKSAIIQTDTGKRLISNYLAKNVSKLNIRHDLVLDIDSELVTQHDRSANGHSTANKSHTTPTRAVFTSHSGYSHQYLLEHIHQTKGEAELAQVDWLFDIINDIKENESVISVVTSADIDTVTIHLFCLALHWPRKENGQFRNKVYVMLQKQQQEIYDITGIIEILEQRFGRMSVPNLSIALCLGGNDFLPKFNGFSHERWLLEIIKIPAAVENIVKFVYDKRSNKPVTGSINEDIYLEVVKRLYCPATVDVNNSEVTLDIVRQMSIKRPNKEERHPSLWMPPKSALLKVVQLINWQIDYYLTASTPNADLPDLSRYGCLEKNSTGLVRYNFGQDVRVERIESLLTVSNEDMKVLMERAKKQGLKARQEGKQKRPRETTTPSKTRSRKRRPLMSTPVKKKLPTE